MIILADERVKILENLKNSEKTVDIQYLQLCFIGPPKVGKTTTCNRLLQLPSSVTQSRCKVGSYNQKLTLIRRHKWHPSKGVGEETQLVLDLFESLVPLTDNMLGSSNTTLNAQFFSDRDTSHREVHPVQESSSKLQAVLAHLKNVTRSDHSKITNLSDSTFLNIHDIGGQPRFFVASPYSWSSHVPYMLQHERRV